MFAPSGLRAVALPDWLTQVHRCHAVHSPSMPSSDVTFTRQLTASAPVMSTDGMVAVVPVVPVIVFVADVTPPLTV